MESEKNSPILVTGATGYVAGWIVKKLLDDGWCVHAAVRSPENRKKVGHLLDAAEKTPGELKLFKADLLEKGSYAEAMEGCEKIIHTASPFIIAPENPVKDLIRPAVLGTENVLEQANACRSVRRVVITSSVVAICGDNIDQKKNRNRPLTENDWNFSSSENYQPYAYSKTLAEKHAWKIHSGQNRWSMVSINPSFVIGPGISPEGTSESYRIVKQMADGTMRSGLPHMGIAAVDVRDLADAHIKAAINPDASGRYIVSGCNTTLMGLADALRTEYGARYPFPKRQIPKPMVWLFGPLMNPLLTRKFISRNAGYPLLLDNTKSIKELGANYRPMEESMVDFLRQMIDNKLI